MKFRVFFRILMIAFICTACTRSGHWRLEERDDRFDLLMDGRLVTSYRTGWDLTKPVLFPLHSPSGIMMTRGYPLIQIPDESRDHPHHMGLFFAFDEINGHHFWNNTSSPPQIRHAGLIEKRVEGSRAYLKTRSMWIGSHGIPLLDEQREMLFSARRDGYAIDFTIRLSARDSTITFHDTKEGLFAIRAADWLTENRGGVYLDAHGRESEKEIWGRRSPWVRLEGAHQGRVMGLAILSHPQGVNAPPYWQARGYGLFSCNPLGQWVYQLAHGEPDPAPFGLVLQPGEHATLKYRVLVYEGHHGPDEMMREFSDYVGLAP
ncbi:PmoA family protein [bacterium]|nr:PmoA family protein [bacterium]